jgi:hypothetical protein
MLVEIWKQLGEYAKSKGDKKILENVREKSKLLLEKLSDRPVHPRLKDINWGS